METYFKNNIIKNNILSYNYDILQTLKDINNNISLKHRGPYFKGNGIKNKYLSFKNDLYNEIKKLATLVAGTVTVSTTKVTTNSRIFLTTQTLSGTEYGTVRVSARSAATSFAITSYRGNNTTTVASGDTSNVAWMIVEPA